MKSNPKIPGGYVIFARCIEESKITQAPPCTREVWKYLILNANHKPQKFKGIMVERGCLFRRYSNILKHLSWYVGYRKMTYSENQLKSAMRYLTNESMIKCTKHRHGVLIEIVNYDVYQNPNNYEATTEATNEIPTNTPTLFLHCSDKEQECKNINNNIPDFEKSGKEESENYYLTKKKKKLSGKRLKTFEKFWEIFNYKKGKAEAADSWLEIPMFTNSLIETIYQAAAEENKNRDSIIAKGGTPKWAQGWITARRWEDYEEQIKKPLKTNSNKITAPDEVREEYKK